MLHEAKTALPGTALAIAKLANRPAVVNFGKLTKLCKGGTVAVFMVSYDLLKEKDGHDYKPLWDELEKFDGHRIQYSSWLVSATGTARSVGEHFAKFVDNNDLLWVNKVRRGQYAFARARSGTNDWLTRHPPEA